MTDILDIARGQVLEQGVGLTQEQALDCLRLPDERVDDLLDLAHEVRLKWCGDEVEVEGIVSLKTGGLPGGLPFLLAVRRLRLTGPRGLAGHPGAGPRGAGDGGHGGDGVLHRRGRARSGPAPHGAGARRRGRHPGRGRHQRRVLAGHADPQARSTSSPGIGVHRYNHNLETARSYFGRVVTTHSFEERWDTCEMVREAGMELCCGGIVGMGESVEQRAEFAAQLAALGPDEVPLNFLNPRPGTPFGDLEPMPAVDALRAVAAFRLVMPRTILRFAGGREITLGDLAERGVRGGVNAVIVGNYLTTLGRPAGEDLAMLAELKMPIKALAQDL